MAVWTIFVITCTCAFWAVSRAQTNQSLTCTEEDFEDMTYNPNGPKLLCCLLPDEFHECQNPPILVNPQPNDTDFCSAFGGGLFEEVQRASVFCEALEGIECHGNRTFIKRNVPCLSYSRVFFPTIMFFSVFLGFCGIDRFCMGYCCLGLAKLLTLGGLGVWWVVDVILLLSGNLVPANGVTWERFY